MAVYIPERVWVCALAADGTCDDGDDGEDEEEEGEEPMAANGFTTWKTETHVRCEEVGYE